MNRMSPKRQAAVRGGAVKLAYNSTFGRPQPGTMAGGKARPRDSRRKPLAKAGRGELAKAKAAAWKEFSRYVRLRDADEFGMLKCCTCSTVKYWKSMHAGHFVSRKYSATFIHPWNVHGQCPGCNRFKSGAPLEYDAFLKRRYNTDTPEGLRRLARTEKKWTPEDFREAAALYRTKADKIITETPTKVKA